MAEHRVIWAPNGRQIGSASTSRRALTLAGRLVERRERCTATLAVDLDDDRKWFCGPQLIARGSRG